MSSAAPLLQVDSLCVDYGSKRRRFRAVERVSFGIPPAQTVGLVGESGSGKSTIGKAILGLVPVSSGSIHFDGEDITHVTPRRRRELTRDIQVIFQDPYGSLNPARTIGSTLAEPLTAYVGYSRADVRRRVVEVLDTVGLPAQAAERYPADFSGGQRQRIAIARAIVVRPRFIVCDEAVSALDLSIQAQVLNLLEDLRSTLHMSYLFISHDLTVVAHVSAQIGVLYRGRLVEFGDADRVNASPAHPYTAMLQAAAPVPDQAEQRVRRSTFMHRAADLAARESAQPGSASPNRHDV